MREGGEEPVEEAEGGPHEGGLEAGLAPREGLVRLGDLRLRLAPGAAEADVLKGEQEAGGEERHARLPAQHRPRARQMPSSLI